MQLEMELYFSEPTISRDDDMQTWWRKNASRLPLMSAPAKKCLAPPLSSVASERLFSTAGDVLTDNRSRLLPEREG